MDEERRFLVTSAPGLQDLLAEELTELGLQPQVDPSGAVVLTGDWPIAAKVLVRSRIASRVFLSLRRFSARNKAMLYQHRLLPSKHIHKLQCVLFLGVF